MSVGWRWYYRRARLRRADTDDGATTATGKQLTVAEPERTRFGLGSCRAAYLSATGVDEYARSTQANVWEYILKLYATKYTHFNTTQLNVCL